MDLTVTTAKGGTFTILDASALGFEAVIGHTASDSTLRVFRFAEDDTVEVVR